MTESLAEILRARLAGLPLMDRLVGLVRTYETQVPNGEDLTRPQRTPMPINFTAQECERDPLYLTPSRENASIFFFEDFGSTPYAVGQGIKGMRSVLRLIGWLNPTLFDAPITDALLLTTLERALQTGHRFRQVGEFTDLLVTYSMLPADTALLSRYTLEGPLLYLPYRLIGLELVCTYRLNTACPLPFPARTGGSTPLPANDSFPYDFPIEL